MSQSNLRHLVSTYAGTARAQLALSERIARAKTEVARLRLRAISHALATGGAL